MVATQARCQFAIRAWMAGASVALTGACPALAGSDGGLSGGSGGGGCNPFTLVDASGRLYGVSSTAAGMDMREVPVTIQALSAGPVPMQTHSGSAGSGQAMGAASVAVSSGDVFGLTVVSQSSVSAAGATAFNRTDSFPSVVLSLGHPARIALMWSASASGVTVASVRLQDGATAMMLADGTVESYLAPAQGSGRTVVMLPAGTYWMTIHATSQCTAQGPLTASAAYTMDAALGCTELADITNDGAVNGMDLAALLAAWGPVPARHACDLDQSGAVGGADLALLLAAW